MYFEHELKEGNLKEAENALKRSLLSMMVCRAASFIECSDLALWHSYLRYLLQYKSDTVEEKATVEDAFRV